MPIVTFRPSPDTEYRPIPSCPGFEASSCGHVRRADAISWVAERAEGKIGYIKVSLHINGKGRPKWLHRLVCEAFHGVPIPPRVFTAHWNGIVSDCAPSNLRWATKSENEADKIRHGRTNRGSRNGQAKITDEQARSIAARLTELPRSSGDGLRIKKGALAPLIAELGISGHAIRAIAGGRLRRHLCQS